MLNNKLSKQRDNILNHYQSDLGRRYDKKTVAKRLSAAIVAMQIFDEKGLTFSQESFRTLRDEIEVMKNKNIDEDKMLCITTRKQLLYNIKKLFKWLQLQKGYKHLIKDEYIAELVLTKKAQNELKTYIAKLNEPPTQEEFDLMYDVAETDYERSLLITLASTGIRNSALKTLPIRAVHFKDDGTIYIHQNPADGVETKNGNNIYVVLMFTASKHREAFNRHYNKLISMGYMDNDPLFPIRKAAKGKSGSFEKSASILTKTFATSNYFLNRIIEDLGRKANLKKLYTVHSFKHYYAMLLKPYLTTAEEIAACAKSMGHKTVDLLFNTYGKTSVEEDIEIMSRVQRKILEVKENGHLSVLQKIREYSAALPSNQQKILFNALSCIDEIEKHKDNNAE